MLPQFWMFVGAFSTFLGLKSTDQNQNLKGITGLSICGKHMPQKFKWQMFSSISVEQNKLG